MCSFAEWGKMIRGETKMNHWLARAVLTVVL